MATGSTPGGENRDGATMNKKKDLLPMILSDEETRARYLESGVWGTATIDAVFRKNAQDHPDRLALVDAPDLAEWTSGAPQSLTYAEAEKQVSRMATLFKHLGLAPDQVISTLLPNTVRTMLVYLAAWRAGLIVAPMPLTWRRRSMLPALDAIGTRAIVTIDHLEDEDVGIQVRDMAAELFGIRHVLGMGDRLAEGIIDIDMFLSEIGEDDSGPDLDRKENAADHVATVTFTGTADGRIVPVPRSHNQWIASGLMTFLEARIDDASTMLSPFMPTGMAGLGGAVLPWLLSAGTLHLNHIRSLPGFFEHCSVVEPDHVLCPATLAVPFANGLDQIGSGAALLPVWPGIHAESDGLSAGQRTVVDLTVLDDLAIVAARRDDGDTGPLPLPLGTITAPRGAEQALPLVDLKSIKPETDSEDAESKHEILVVAGPMVPAAKILKSFEFVPTHADGYLETSLMVTVPTGKQIAVPEARAGRILLVGGLPVGITELDDAYSGDDAVRNSALYVTGTSGAVPKFGLAVVPEHAAPYSLTQALTHAAAAGLATHVRPELIVRTASLPRNRKGELDISALQATLRAG